jgi:hypothetical protein
MLDRDTSVGIEKYYGLDGRGSIPGRDKGYLYSAQRPYRLSGSLSLPASYPVGARGSFPRVKRPPSYAEVENGGIPPLSRMSSRSVLN